MDEFLEELQNSIDDVLAKDTQTITTSGNDESLGGRIDTGGGGDESWLQMSDEDQEEKTVVEDDEDNLLFLPQARVIRATASSTTAATGINIRRGLDAEGNTAFNSSSDDDDDYLHQYPVDQGGDAGRHFHKNRRILKKPTFENDLNNELHDEEAYANFVTTSMNQIPFLDW